MMTEQRFTRIADWLYAFFIAIVYTLVNGYYFNTSDQAEHLPEVYQILDPSLYRNDFFMQHYHQVFSVRFYWVWFVALLGKLMPVSLVCFVLQLLSLTAIAKAWMNISARLSSNRLSPYVSALFGFIFFNRLTAGGNSLADAMFISSSLAEAFASWALYYWLKSPAEQSSYRIPALLLGLATLFQALIGLQLFLIILAILFVDVAFRGSRVLNLTLFIFYYLLIASALFVPLFMSEARQPPGDNQLFFHALYYWRCPWHYVPSLFPPLDLLLCGLLTIASMLVLLLYKKDRRVLLFFLLVTAGCVFYWLMLEKLGQMWVGKIQWFKTTMWVATFASVLLPGFVIEKLWPGNDFRIGRIRVTLLGVLSLFGLFFITNSALFTDRPRYRVGYYPEDALMKMHRYIGEHTLTDDVFLAPPEDDAFSCETKRSMVTNYKALIHEPFYFNDWVEGMKQRYHLEADMNFRNAVFFGLMKNYNSRLDSAELSGVDYVLFDEKACQVCGALPRPVHREGSWLLFRVNGKVR
jgi:hypothetical protein